MAATKSCGFFFLFVTLHCKNRIMQSIYHFILLIVAAVAIFIGYRKGLIKQLAGIVGMILGIVSVHLFSDSVEPIIREQFPSFQGGFLEDYTYSVVTACVIFLAGCGFRDHLHFARHL